MVIEKLVTKWKAFREARFLKKHYCVSRSEYNRKYDPDVTFHAGRIVEYYHGYLYIHAMTYPAYKSAYDQYGDWLQGLTMMKDWCNFNCTGKWREDIHRVSKSSYQGHPWEEGTEWRMDEMGGGDVIFFAFKSEKDMMMFLLRWS
jgi:hypothetical protein